jgi:hypothetical protein
MICSRWLWYQDPVTVLNIQRFAFVSIVELPLRNSVLVRYWRQHLGKVPSWTSKSLEFKKKITHNDRLCGLVVRVPGYRSRGPGFDSQRYQIFWEIVGPERGSLSLMSTIEETLGRNSRGSGLENREYYRGDPLRWPRDALYQQKVGTNFADMRRSLG